MSLPGFGTLLGPSAFSALTLNTDRNCHVSYAPSALSFDRVPRLISPFPL